jgi:hypothetical protein
VTYPQQYAQPQAPSFPQAPEQPQFPQGYPQAPAFPAPQYGAPQGYPQPGYPQQYGQPQPAPQLAAGSLEAFYQQPSVGGGAALSFQVGTRHVGVVTRPVTNADIQQQTQQVTNTPMTFKDGRPKFVMKVPLQLQPTPDRPDGLAQWWVKGGARSELVRAMAEAGAPEGPPEAGAILDITCTGEKQIPNMNPAKIYQVRYTRPNGASAVPQVQSAPATQAPAVQQAQSAPVTHLQQVPVPVAGPTQNLTPEQQALLAQLTGQQAS